MVKMTNEKRVSVPRELIESAVERGTDAGEGALVLQFRSIRLARGDASLFWVPALFSGLQGHFVSEKLDFWGEWVISSHDSGIYPSPNSWRCQLRTDLVEKREQIKDLLSFF
jgi:hypothetical protein